jgi:hypothetical protein
MAEILLVDGGRDAAGRRERERGGERVEEEVEEVERLERRVGGRWIVLGASRMEGEQLLLRASNNKS